MLFEPRNLRRGESWQHRVTNVADDFFVATEFSSDDFALGGGGGVTPKFGGPNDLILFIERYKPVLLATNANALHLRRAGLSLF